MPVVSQMSPLDIPLSSSESVIGNGYHPSLGNTSALTPPSCSSVLSGSPEQNGSLSIKGESTNGGGGGSVRSRLMFDPLTELPRLEGWFEENPHPSWIQIDQFTENLNSMAYRQTYPAVSTHNVKIWFKNRRAKCKRLSGVSGPGVI